ncbi:SPOR domain-containing protein [Andreprevotia chitinilytica]|uniref:SPOR domain-containing protein n=1 Tax=Andreprevotia chitinilytica TaxID=396808 RepID=UPI001B7FF5FC|nr:SPOR domain-containing protein [Andreprevotia chitinilytica]
MTPFPTLANGGGDNYKMARDMKKSRTASTGSSNGGGGSLLTGLILGVLVGVAVAVGIALYLNRSSNPFAAKTTQETPPDAVSSAPAVAVNAAPEVLRPNGADKDTTSAATANSASKPASAASSVERFDFYKVLPELNDKSDKADKPQQDTKKADASPPAKVEAPKGAYLQVGAFQNEQDADNLKAKLALMGVEAKIQSAEVPGKGLWHRVRIGPFASLSEMDKTRGDLKSNGVDSTVVKGN